MSKGTVSSCDASQSPGALRGWSVFVWVSVVACASGAIACDSDTGGRAVTLEIALSSAVADGASRPGVFTTSTGWDVELDEAVIALGPIYAYADSGSGSASSSARGAARSKARFAWSAATDLVVPRARAHSGFDPLSGRTVRAEYLGQIAFDALSIEAVPLGPIDGEAGPAASVTVVLDAPRGELGSPTGPLRGHQAWVAGTARRDGASVAFAGGLDLPDDGLVRRIDGVPVAADIEEGGTLTLSIHLLEWLDRARFESLTEQRADGTFAIDRASQVRNAWYIGARHADAFSAAWAPGAGVE